jgi:hypothetical protein
MEKSKFEKLATINSRKVKQNHKSPNAFKKMESRQEVDMMVIVDNEIQSPNVMKETGVQKFVLQCWRDLKLRCVN